MIKSPQAFRTSLNDRIKTQARARKVPSADLLEQVFFHRLLARVSDHDQQGWMLKGGQALLVRYTDVRHSRDVDLLYRHIGSELDEAVAALRAAAAIPLDDHIRFEYLDTRTTGEPGHALCVRFTTYIGNKKMSVLSVDVVVGQVPLGRPVTATVRPVVLLEGIDIGPQIQLYPIIDHLADKICAMHERHAGAPSSRYRDLVDMLVIIQREEIDGRELHTALHHQVRVRRSRGTDIILPTRFQAPAIWGPGYRQLAEGVPGLDELRTLAQALPLACSFIDPLLADTPPGQWSPTSLSWD